MFGQHIRRTRSLKIIQTNETSSTDDSEKYVWRMHQPTEPRKYQLFPAAKEKLSIAAGQKNGDAESSQSTATGQNGTNEKDRSLLTNALRLGLKPKEQTVNRRRKPSMPADLGPSPMTTVQEVAMDSREYKFEVEGFWYVL